MDRNAAKVWWLGLARWVAIALLASVVLSMLASVTLLGLPHAWDTATSWTDIKRRTSWLVHVLVPVGVATHLLIRFRHRIRLTMHEGDRPGSSEKGGRHR
ncbi:hypothetical protein [Streptomyces sp. SID12501]|uniref:Uncharacterized protein n=1 Tax=Streptomyces sp. SID12501 TaxID=2706042 RepID=A0A6B3BPI0_9ACTN|nr:hypothetical protein [Streptomyces sp. SID12501]NEC86262.1 hypothetical protein [Streptomyces sp. SID12501]